MSAGYASRLNLTEYLRPWETKQEKRLRVAKERRLSNSFIQLRCLQVKEDYQLSDQQKLKRLLGEYAAAYLTKYDVDKSVQFMHRSVHVTDDVNQFWKYKEEHPEDKGICTFYRTTGLSSYRAMRWHTDGNVSCHDHMQGIENARREFKSKNKMEPGQSVPLVMPCITYMADLPAKNPKLGYSPYLTKCPQYIREKKALLKMLRQRIRDIHYTTDSIEKRLSKRKYISDYYPPQTDLSRLPAISRSQNASTLSASSSETSCGCIAESLLQDLEKGQQARQRGKKQTIKKTQNAACSLDCSSSIGSTDEGTVLDQSNTATSLNTESNGMDTDDYVTSQIAEANLRSCIELLDSMTLDPKEEGVPSFPTLYDNSLSRESTNTTHVEADTNCDTCDFDKDERSYRNLMFSLLKAVNLNIHRLLVDVEDELKNTPGNSMHTQASDDQHSLLDSCPSSQHTTKKGSRRGSDRPLAPSSKKVAASAEKDKTGTVEKIPMFSTNDASKMLLDIMSYTLQGALQYVDTSTEEQDSEARQQLLSAAKNIVTDKRIVAALLCEVRKFIPQDDSEARQKEWEKRVMPLAKP